jgi:hypothetical protein
MALYISINTASSSHSKSPIDNAIVLLAAQAAVEKRKGGLPDGPSLDVTFLLPGEFESPPFEGMRMGGYTEEGRTLHFQTAVPEHILNSALAPNYVSAVMSDVVEHAHDFFASNKLAFDRDHWRRVLSNMTVTSAPVGSLPN